jgi:acetylglutamate kinase
MLCKDVLSSGDSIKMFKGGYTKGISLEDAIRKSKVLIEALPYIQSFKDKVVVIKFGGSAMVNIKTFRSILQDVVFMKTIGMRPIIVHGGGPHISEEMKKRGKNPLFINGYRITDKETLEIAIEVLVNQIGGLIINKINEMGAEAVGVWSEKKSPVKARKYVFKEQGKSKEYDLGYVGELTEIECKIFSKLCESGKIPVVPPIAEGTDKENFNVNADNVASFIARYLKAEKLVFISNTHGILTDPSNPDSLASTLHEDEVNKLIENNVIKDGMLPKAQACISALTSGVRKAHIIDGKIPHSLLLEIFTDKGIGTQIIV